nr:RuvB-like protein 1 [Cryptomonas sp.]
MNEYKNKITWHSHIKGFDLKCTDFSGFLNSGLVGQTDARLSIHIVMDLIRKNRTSGQVFLITGGSGSGKTAIGLALGKQLGTSIPFSLVNGSEFCFLNSKKTNQLIQKFRKAIGLRIVENIEFYEGEVFEIDSSLKNKREFDIYSSLIIGLRTSEGSLRIKLHDSLSEKFLQSKIKIGDIVYIEPKKCAIKIIGRSSSFYKEDEIIDCNFISIPTGKVFKQKSLVQDITFNDLDMVNIQHFDNSFSRTDDVSDYLRQEVDKLVSTYLESKKACLIHGVLFIDEAHTLGFDSFCFLTKLLDLKFSPLILLSTNRTTLIDLKNLWNSDLPLSFLDRCLTIRTKLYRKDEMAQIVTLKAKDNGIILSGRSIVNFSKISDSTSLRFSILLGLASGLVSNSLGKYIVSSSIVQFVNFIFLFFRESQKLCENGKIYLKVSRIM